MADFSSVPVVDIHRENIDKYWPMLLSAVRSSTFVAIDTELSGLGNRKKLFAKDMDERYRNMCDVAKTRSIIALGLSCFQYLPINIGAQNNNFLSQTFNFLLLSSQEYTVDPSSLKFLVDHGFDFNAQYSLGLQYEANSEKLEDKPSIQRLFVELVVREVPVVLHNGLVDLVFLYHSFHCPLPANITTFLADLSLIFPAGLYDTKFITEFEARAPASYLEYVFRKCQRKNHEMSVTGKKHVTMSFLSYCSKVADVNYLPCALQPLATDMAQQALTVCENYASHGWCAAGSMCNMSHDVDLIIDIEDAKIGTAKKRKNRRKRKKVMDMSEEKLEIDDSAKDTEDHDGNIADDTKEIAHDTEENVPDTEDKVSDTEDKVPDTEDKVPDTEDTEIDVEMEVSDPPDSLQPSDQPKPQDSVTETVRAKINGTDTQSSQSKTDSLVKEGRTEGHRAGFDAYMTAFTFAYYATLYSDKALPHTAKLADFDLKKYTNKLTLSGKDIPLQIMKSSFVKPSKKHKQRMDLIKCHFTK